jgi:HNH endonuclease
LPDRPNLPRDVRRDVLIESGYRCAFPSCRQHPVEVDHIHDVAKGGTDDFQNLVALCALCHVRKTRGEIDRKALLQLKANLSVINHRYGDYERRILERFALEPGATAVEIPIGFEVLMMYLVRDGLVRPTVTTPLIRMTDGAGRPFNVGNQLYELLPQGRAFVTQWVNAVALDPAEGSDG